MTRGHSLCAAILAPLVAMALFGPAAADHVPASTRLDMGHGAQLVLPIMNPERGKKLFVDKGCVACHAVNGIGGHDAPNMDAHAIGTSLTTASDAPALDCAYKLQEYAGRPKRKRSTGKATWPGRKQVYRRYVADGQMTDDLLALDGDAADGEALIQPVLQGGTMVAPQRSLQDARAHAAAQLGRLPAHLRRLEPTPTYHVMVSGALRSLAEEVDRDMAHARVGRPDGDGSRPDSKELDQA